MIPVAVFICTNIITKSALKYIAWDVIWLVAGGIALGYASKKTGLASHMVRSLPCEIFAQYLVLASAMLLSLVMANFMSHTATANLLLPPMVAFCVQPERPERRGVMLDVSHLCGIFWHSESKKLAF